MTKWTLPEGRKPLTDADIAALTRRLAGTAIDYKELYEAAKRDAEEAEAYVAELEDKLFKTEGLLAKTLETLEKLAKLGNGDRYGNSDGNMIARTTLSELKGEKDE